MYTRYMLHCAEVGQSFVASSDEFANIARYVHVYTCHVVCGFVDVGVVNGLHR